MDVTLRPEMQRMVEEKIKSGEYASPDEVVHAALASFQSRSNETGQFLPGELNALLAEGEASIQSEGTLDGDEALRARREGRVGEGEQEQLRQPGRQSA